MINLREILMKAFKGAVGNLPDYKIRLNAISYYEKGILKEEDVEVLDAMIDSENAPAEEPAELESTFTEDADESPEEGSGEEVVVDEK